MVACAASSLPPVLRVLIDAVAVLNAVRGGRTDGHIQLADLGGILDQTEENQLVGGSAGGDKPALPLLTASIYRPHLPTRQSVSRDGYSIHCAGSKSYRHSRSKSIAQRTVSASAAAAATASSAGESEGVAVEGAASVSGSHSAHHSVSMVSEQDGGRSDLGEDAVAAAAAATARAVDGSIGGFENPNDHGPQAEAAAQDGEKKAPRRKLSIMGTMG